MRSVFYVFAAAGLLLLVLVNTSFLLSPAPPRPGFRAADTSSSLDYRDRAVRTDAAQRLDAATATAAPSDDSTTLAVPTPLDFGPEPDGSAEASSTPAAASLQVGSLPRECSAEPDAERRALLRLIGGGRCVAGRALCHALRRALSDVPSLSTHQRARPSVVVTSFVNGQEAMLDTLAASTSALRLPLIALALDAPAAATARSPQSPPVAVVDLSRPDSLPATSFIPGEAREGTGVALPTLLAGGSSSLTTKWRAVAALLASGAAVLYADIDSILGADPFQVAQGDSDLEVMSEAWEADSARGFIMGSDDPAMGWSRYCETMAIVHLSPSLFLAQPTFESVAVARRMARHAAGWGDPASGAGWASGTEEAEAWTSELVAPAHDEVSRVGASVRVLSLGCFLNARVSLARMSAMGSGQPATRFAVLMPGRGVAGAGARQAAAAAAFHRGEALGGEWAAAGGGEQLTPRWQLERIAVDPLMRRPVTHGPTKHLVLRSRCAKTPAAASPDTRPLNLIAPPDSAWPVHCDDDDNSRALCAVLRRVAVDRAVLAAVSNQNILPMLGQFVDIVKQVGVPNFLVVALDDRTKSFLDGKGVASYRRSLVARGGGTDNHATSSLKFQILAEMLRVGVSVLLSDVDIVFTQNPFVALYRDTDVEGMTDGWDDASSYGHTLDTPVLGSAVGPLHSFRLVARNSGLFYLSATHQALRLMKVLAARVSVESVWDQSAYNQEIFRLSHANQRAPGVSVRTMNYMCFLNTKFLFRYMRKDPQLIDRGSHVPVSCHVNYHPEKEDRMLSIKAYYMSKDDSALGRWNGGEGPSTGGCSGKVGVTTDRMPALDATFHRLAASLLAADLEWSWGGGGGGMRFRADGTVSTPRGEGTWGAVPSQWRKDSVHISIGGQTYLLMFLSEKWAFTAVRCSDEEVSFGQLAGQTPRDRLVW